MIPVNKRHLKRQLSDYVHYYHEDRTHLGLGQGGNLWMSVAASGEVWSFDVKTGEFGTHNFTLPQAYPEDSIVYWTKGPGEPLPPSVPDLTTSKWIRRVRSGLP
jgi:hypothetical protein